MLPDTDPWWPLDRTTLEALARSTGPILIVNGIDDPATASAVARAIHAAGPRRREPFIELSCGGLPTDVLESELFGHRSDPAAGLFRAKHAIFSLAHRGTLCLLDIDHTSASVQHVICRVIDSGHVTDASDGTDRAADVRLIATIMAAGNRPWTLTERITRELQSRFTLVPIGTV